MKVQQIDEITQTGKTNSRQAVIDIYSETDDVNPNPILKRRIHLADAVVSNKNKHPLKRLFDISVALTVLLLASPLMLLTALFIKMTSPGPVLF